MTILSLLQTRFAAALSEFVEEPAPFAAMVRPAQDARFGDYQANCAMPLAKQLATNPRELAQRIINRLDVNDLCEPPEVAGPGFINLRLRDDWVSGSINRISADERLGVAAVADARTIIVDFSSPNVAKPMHVGHLRSTVIGDALARTLRFLGHRVITDNHIGDWGTQFGMIIYGYKHFVDATACQTDAVDELARLYRLVNRLCDYQTAQGSVEAARERVNTLSSALAEAEGLTDASNKQAAKALKKQRAELATARDEVKSLESLISSVQADAELLSLANAHPDIVRDSRNETAKLHAGDPENRELWEQFLPQCLAALQRLYDRLRISFDLTLGESFYNPYLNGVVADLKTKGLAEVSDGAECVFDPGHTAPFIVRKADGAFTYATTDLATIQYRVQELQADEILYVVDARQADHFKLLFATAKRWGFDQTVFRHVSFGTVMGQDGRPYKTRSGDTVGLESLLDEAVAKAAQIVAGNLKPDGDAGADAIPEVEQQRIAEMVGIGGIKYADLQHHRESDYVFDSDKMLAMTGNTATYMQYAQARVQGIFRRAGIDVHEFRSQQVPIQLVDPVERTLALKLLRYGEALDDVIADERPNLLTQYLFELANDLTAFYDRCPVLKAEDAATRNSRLALCDLSGRVIVHGLSLLGIEAPERM